MAGDVPHSDGVSRFEQALKALATPKILGKDSIHAPESSALDKKKKQSRSKHGSQSKAKGVEAIPTRHSFWNHVDDYFRDVTSEDISIIQPP